MFGVERVAGYEGGWEGRGCRTEEFMAQRPVLCRTASVREYSANREGKGSKRTAIQVGRYELLRRESVRNGSSNVVAN